MPSKNKGGGTIGETMYGWGFKESKATGSEGEREKERETKTDSNQNANDKNESFVIIINNEDMTFTGFALSGEIWKTVL